MYIDLLVSECTRVNGVIKWCKWPVAKAKHVKMKPRIYGLFVLDLDDACKFLKYKTW